MLQQLTRSREERTAEATAETGTDPAVMAAGVSVLLSWYYFFVRGERHLGLFVGLWPPTILAFSSYFEQTRMSDQVRSALGSASPIDQLISR